MRGNVERKIESAVEEFVHTVKNSREYKEYAIQQTKLHRYPELKQQIDEYREKNFLLQTSVDADEMFDRAEEFRKEYEEFREDPLVSDFLAAELAFCRLMQSVNIRITELLEFD